VTIGNSSPVADRRPLPASLEVASSMVIDGERSSPLRRLAALGAVETDTEEERLRRSTLVLSTCLVCVLTPFWVVTYFALGLTVPASIPLGYLVVSIALLIWFARTRRYVPFRTIQLALTLLLPFALQWSLGGFVASSGVSLWALASALGALMFSGTREAVPWFGAYLALLAVSTALEPVLEPAAIPGAVRIAFFAGNMAGPSLVAYLLLQFFVREREREHARSERLLLNVLPAPVAARLKRRDEVIADRFPEATVLFADIVDFTPLSAALARTWWRCSTTCSRPSTGWPTSEGWRRSRRSATRTWWRVGSPRRAGTTARQSPRWRSRCCASATGGGPAGVAFAFGSASTPARWSPA
jgi:hypothetical protein